MGTVFWCFVTAAAVSLFFFWRFLVIQNRHDDEFTQQASEFFKTRAKIHEDWRERNKTEFDNLCEIHSKEVEKLNAEHFEDLAQCEENLERAREHSYSAGYRAGVLEAVLPVPRGQHRSDRWKEVMKEARRLKRQAAAAKNKNRCKK